MTKNERIKQSLKLTSEKRKKQICKVYEVKFDKSHLSNEKLKYLNRLFLEAKWIYNFSLSQEDIFKVSDKLKIVTILNKDKMLEEREIKNLSSQMKQSIIDRCKQNIVNLSKSKKKGLNVGKLKYKSEISSIPLKQFNSTYKIINKKYIKLQGFKKLFNVIGLNQLPLICDISNATLIKRNNNFYLKITTFQEKISKIKNNNKIGIDFGISDDFVFSNGIKFNTIINISKIKKEHKKLSNKKKGSRNQYKQILKLKKEYEKNMNIKKDIKNKLISFLKNNYNIIAIQDEQVKNWHKGLFGKQIQQSILGITLSDLKKLDNTKIIDKWFPSTKKCYNCGKINKISLSNRIYNCSCGLEEDRDIKSSKTILKVVLNNIGEELTELTLEEKKTSVKMINYFKDNLYIKISYAS